MNIQKMMKDLQRMQNKIQEDVDALEVEASAGGGVVVAKMNGRKFLTAITLTADAITPEDPGLMQDLILAAVNDAQRKADEELQKSMGGMLGGGRIPGMF